MLVVCSKCNNEFESTRNDNPPCYDCALKQITGNSAPEEGDFNAAALRSGTLSEEEVKYLREDMISVEEGRSIPGVFEDEEDPRREIFESHFNREPYYDEEGNLHGWDD